MHAIVLLTAMTATSGLFGHGARRSACPSGSCGSVAARPMAPAYAPSYAPSPAYSYAPAAPGYAPAPMAPQMAATYQSYYAAPSSCATGSCPRR